MSPRVTSDFWVSAYLRRCAGAGAPAMLRRRGAREAGAIFIKIDRLDGTSVLFGPAPQGDYDAATLDRLFARAHEAETIDSAAAEERMRKEIRFDPDLWFVEVEDRAGRNFLEG
jgi:hypothetical protein